MARTADQMAVDLLLAGDQAGLTRLAAELKARGENLVTCPECGDRGPHEDNGESGFQLMYCCRACGRHFDAEEAEAAADVYGTEG
jgi:DNA-directed RNA polymerase subunit RPC12/RpoP